MTIKHSLDIADELFVERRSQVEEKGYDEDHDDGHRDGSIASAAATYAFYASTSGWRDGRLMDSSVFVSVFRWLWPSSWNFKARPRRRCLIIAGALIIAEIERIDRESKQSTPQGGS